MNPEDLTNLLLGVIAAEGALGLILYTVRGGNKPKEDKTVNNPQ